MLVLVYLLTLLNGLTSKSRVSYFYKLKPTTTIHNHVGTRCEEVEFRQPYLYEDKKKLVYSVVSEINIFILRKKKTTLVI